MSGIGHSITQSIASDNQSIDGILGARHWDDPVITYSFPPNESFLVGYDADDAEVIATFEAVTDAQKTTAHFALSKDMGSDAADGFSVAGFTNQTFEFVPASSTSDPEHLRFGILDKEYVDFAFAYYPSTSPYGGDIAFNHLDFAEPVAGDYAWMTHLHEIGHALGLSHGHENEGGKGRLPRADDEMQYTLMSYRSHNTSERPPESYQNEETSYAQTFMALDIQALQHLYGANYETNSGDTVYSWQREWGHTYVNGEIAIEAAGMEVFMTIWDGGGHDTYDLSAYGTSVVIDLTPGSGTKLALDQRADLLYDSEQSTDFANYSIYNAMLFEGDERSLIEDAIGGNASDTITGNQGANKLMGLDGNDTLVGLDGLDLLSGGAGGDSLDGGNDRDRLFGNKGEDLLKGANGDDYLAGGSQADMMFGGGGDDVLIGGLGRDILNGGAGQDRMLGGVGNDVFVFNAISGTQNIVRDFQDGNDLLQYTDPGLTFLDIELTQQGANLLVDFGDSSAILRRVDIADITEDDFLLA